MINKELVFEISSDINASPEKVWDVLTNPNIIKKYLFGTDTICDWKVGSRITFQGEFNGMTYKDGGYILDIEENKILRYSYWSSFSELEEKEENYSIVSYILKEMKGKTQLTLSQSGFPDEARLEHSKANWKMVIESIKKIAEE